MPPLFGVGVGTFHGDDHRVTIEIGGESVELTPARADAVANEIKQKAKLARRAKRREEVAA